MFAELSTPLVADACIRCGVALRAAPAGIVPFVPGSQLAGRVLPARHYGSVDVFLEALGAAEPGDVLVVDNGGRAGRGLRRRPDDPRSTGGRRGGRRRLGPPPRHARARRDRRARVQLRELPAGARCGSTSRRPSALTVARFGPHTVTSDDLVFADDDGVVRVAAERVDEVLAVAREIWQNEREQARQDPRGERRYVVQNGLRRLPREAHG